MVNQKCKVNKRGFCQTLIEFEPGVYEKLWDEKQATIKAGRQKTYGQIVNNYLKDYYFGVPLVIKSREPDNPQEKSTTQSEMVKKE